MKRKIWFFPLLLLFVGLVGCSSSHSKDNAIKTSSGDTKTMLNELAYDVNSSSGYTIYLRENGIYQPYLVLSSNYNGNCLLLRKYVLDDLIRYNELRRYAGYYNGSEIDNYINNEFINSLDEKVLKQIVETSIEITSKESLGISGEALETISRNIFLLSYTEVGGKKTSTILNEGKTIGYFNSTSRRIATTADGTKAVWWLRTANTWYDAAATTVSLEGGAGLCDIGGWINGECKNAIRPAFCIDGTALIKQRDIMPNVTVYVLE